MQREGVVERVINLLRGSGWDHSYLDNRCFDLFARSDEDSLILKVHENVDSADRESAEELKNACKYLGASPVIVGEKTSRGELEPQVVYERYDVPTVKTETLRRYLHLQEKPVVYNRRGGYYVSIDGREFERQRKEEGFSLNALAKELGVSRKTVSNYREGGSASVEKANRMEEVLGEVLEAADFLEVEFETEASPDNRISKQLVKIGFEASGFSRAPFDAAARDEEERFVGKEEDQVGDPLLKFLERLQEMAESRTFLVTDREEDYTELSSISEKRLKRMEGKEEFKEAVG